VGAGTIEFLVDSSRKFYFLEMNTRLQVEHPVTEWVTGVDLVNWQIHVAQGERLKLLEPIEPRGHALEVRVYAEDPSNNFLPSPGRIHFLRVPGGPNVRDDSGVYEGFTVPNFYDPMISKLSVWAPSRAESIARMRRALSEYTVKGITTNLAYLRRVLSHPEFVGGDYDTSFLTRAHPELTRPQEDPNLTTVSLAAAALQAFRKDRELKARLPSSASSSGPSPWRLAAQRRRVR
jgi:acetyl-CoA carboxylase biotin carboxylase subunit